MFLSRAQLLTALDWPDPVNVRTGSMTWTSVLKAGKTHRILSASVVVTDKAIACRMRTALMSRPGRLEPSFEAVWNVTPSTPPQLARWVLEGRERNPRTEKAQEDALRHFRSAVSALGVAPVFKPSPYGPDMGWSTP